jgi:hypothetical protein
MTCRIDPSESARSGPWPALGEGGPLRAWDRAALSACDVVEGPLGAAATPHRPSTAKLDRALTRAIQDLAARPGAELSSTNLLQHPAVRELPAVDVRDAMVAVASLAELERRVGAVLSHAADGVATTVPPAAARGVVLGLADRLGRELALDPVRSRLQRLTADAAQRLRTLEEDRAARGAEAAELVARDPEAATGRLHELGLFDAKLEAALSAGACGAALEAELGRAAHQGREVLVGFLHTLATRTILPGRLDLFGIAPRLTREVMRSAEVGLASELYPFEGVEPDSAAQEALLAYVRGWNRDAEDEVKFAVGWAGCALGTAVAGRSGALAASAVEGALNVLDKLDEARIVEALERLGYARPGGAERIRKAAGLSALLGLGGATLAIRVSGRLARLVGSRLASRLGLRIAARIMAKPLEAGVERGLPLAAEQLVRSGGED